MDNKSEGTPIFWLIPVEKQAALMAYQYRHYHHKLEIPSRPVYRVPEIPTENLPLEEIDKFMRQPPNRPQRIE